MKVITLIHTLCLCVPLVATPSAQATAIISSDINFAIRIRTACSSYLAEHSNRLPSSWAELERHVGQPMDQAFPNVLPTKRYTLLPQLVALTPPLDGSLLILTHRSFRERGTYRNWLDNFRLNLRHQGRYIIYLSSQGEFNYSYVDEAYIQQLFKNHPTLLSIANAGADNANLSQAYTRVILYWSLVSIPILFVIYRRIAKRRR